jgi:uncharacterized membrane protein YbhN (UPF0104 family)
MVSLHHLPPLLGLVLLIGAVFVVEREFRSLKLEDILAALDAIPERALASAFGFTLLAYGVLTFYDSLAVIYAGARVSYWRTAFASFCAYALSHNLGFAAVSGAAVRFRLYAHWGLTPVQIGKVIAFCSLTFGLGGMVLGGAILFVEPGAVPLFGDRLPHYLPAVAGAGLWAIVLAYVLIARSLGHLRLFGHEIALPDARMAVLQVLIAAADVAVTSSILYALLPPAPGLTYLRCLAVYVVATSAGLLASLPGGIGVFDSLVLLGLSPYLDAPRIAGAIIVFRLYYSVIPLFLAGGLFAGNEILLRGREILPAGPAAPGWTAGLRSWNEPDFAVAIAIGAVTICGAMLLLIGLVGPMPDMSWIDPDLAEMNAPSGEFILSLIGAGLLVLAIGLSRRVTLAWATVVVLLLIAASITVVDGMRWWVPTLLAAATALIAPFRRAFYRHVHLTSDPFDLAAALPLLALVLCVITLSAFERHVRGLADQSWWEVVASPEAPNALRLSLVLAVALGALAIWQILRPGRVRLMPWTAETRRQFAALSGVMPAPESSGMLWGEAGEAAIAVRRIGHLIVALGDPVGADEDRVSAIWRLRDLAAQEGATPAVWQGTSHFLEIYADIGLSPVALPTFADRFALCRTERDLEALLASMEHEMGQPEGEDRHIGDDAEHDQEQDQKRQDATDHLADGRV